MSFRLFDNRKHIGGLITAMCDCGLEHVGSDEGDPPSSPTTHAFTCQWLPNMLVEIVVESTWWTDGETLEDSRVKMMSDFCEVRVIDLLELLDRKLEVPLRVYVLEELSKAACHLTGKART